MKTALAWTGANLVPLVLLPLAVVLLWVGLWRIWLPPAGNPGTVARSVTTVDASSATTPTHKVTTVVKASRGAAPSRRSELLTLTLLLLAAGAAVIGVFHDRIGSLELGKDGVKIDLTPEERSGAAELVGQLAASGAPSTAYARGVARYLRGVSLRRPAAAAPARALGATAPGVTAEQATALADAIARDLG